MNRYVGQTEENMNRALLQAEGMAPCVLWIDELRRCLPQPETIRAAMK